MAKRSTGRRKAGGKGREGVDVLLERWVRDRDAFPRVVILDKIDSIVDKVGKDPIVVVVVAVVTGLSMSIVDKVMIVVMMLASSSFRTSFILVLTCPLQDETWGRR